MLLSNPDAKVDAGSCAIQIDALHVEPSLACVGPRVVNDVGDMIHTQCRFPSQRKTYALALSRLSCGTRRGLGSCLYRRRPSIGAAGDSGMISGWCMLLRREAVALVGGVHKGFFLYSQESHSGTRLTTAGCRAGFEPRAGARHISYQSRDPDATQRMRAVSRVSHARKPFSRHAEGVGSGATRAHARCRLTSPLISSPWKPSRHSGGQAGQQLGDTSALTHPEGKPLATIAGGLPGHGIRGPDADRPQTINTPVGYLGCGSEIELRLTEHVSGGTRSPIP